MPKLHYSCETCGTKIVASATGKFAQALLDLLRLCEPCSEARYERGLAEQRKAEQRG